MTLALIVQGLVFLPNNALAAATPSVFSYQGRLTDASGNLLGNTGTVYHFKFSLWDASSGGSKVWPSTPPGSFSTTVRQGVFNVNIGDTNAGYPDALNYTFDNPNIYLQVEVSSDGVSFETLSPRQQVASQAFAQIAGAVISASSTIQTLTNTNLTSVNSTTTRATTTAFAITSLANSLIKVNSIGSLVAATVGDFFSTTSANYLLGTSLASGISDLIATRSTTTNATTTTLSVSGFLTGAGLTNCSNSSDKLLWINGRFTCGVDAGATGSGIAGIGAQYSSFQTGATQSFATSSDTNIGLSIISSGDTHTFTPSWIGVLAAGRGGTGIASPSAAGVLLGSYAGGGYQQVATSSLGLLSDDVREGSSNLYFNQNRFDIALTATTSLPRLTTLLGLLDTVTTRSTTTNATSTTFFAATASTTNLSFTSANGGSITSSGVGTFANILTLGSSTLQNFTFANATGSNATTTTFFTTTGSTTNLYFSTGHGATLALSGTLSVSAATTTTLGITGVTSALLKTNNLGSVVAAVPGSDYLADANGNWTGTFNGQTASYYLANSFSTTSVTYWKSVTDLFSTTSANAFLATKTTDNLTEGVSNQYFTQGHFDTALEATTTLNNLAVLKGITDLIATRSTTSKATTTSLAISSIVSKILKTDANGSVVPAVAGVDYLSASAAGISSLGAQYSPGQTGASQTFATSSDTNLGLTITSNGDTHTFTPSWIGVLAASRGGTGIASPSAAGILLGAYSGGGYQQLATSSLGLLTTNVAEGSNLYFTQTHFDVALTATTSLPRLTTLLGLLDTITTRSTTTNATTTNLFATTASTTNLFFTSANGGSITSTGVGTFANILTLGSTTLQNFTALNSTSTNATTTTFFTTTGSTTNLFFTTGNGATLALSGSLSAGPATTTSLAITSIGSKLLKTNANGSVIGAVAGTDYVANTSGDWAGTFNGQTASYYLANSFSTTSVTYWKSVTDLFSTTSANAFLATKTSDNLTEGVTNQYFTQTHFDTALEATTTLNNLAILKGITDLIAARSTTTNATTTSLAISSIASKILKTNADGSIVPAVAGVDYLSAAAAGISSLSAQFSSPQTGAAQTLATSSDTNLGLTITSNGDTHTFTPSWIGILAANRGGTGISNPSAAGILLGSYAGGSYQQLATSSLGLLTTNVAEGSNLYFTQGHFDTALEATTTLNNLAILKGVTDLMATNATTTSFFATTASTTKLYLSAGSGVLKVVNGLVSLATSNTDYQTPVTLTTTGTSGAATFNGTTLNIPNYSGGSAASSTLLGDNNTFSGTNTFSNPITGSITGNAGTATALQNSRTINNVSFNGTSNITITAASSTLLADNNAFTGGTILGNATATNATTTSLFATIASTTNFFFTSASGGNLSSTGLGTFANILTLASTTLQNFTALNSTSTNATTTTFFTTTGSTTNLFFTSASGGTLALSGTMTASNILATGSTTLQNFTGLRSTTTSATTTSFALTGIVSKILKTNANGSVIAAVSNTDYQAPVALTTTGTTGAATFDGTTLNIPNYGAGPHASSTLLTDNNTFGGTNVFSSTITGSVSGNAGTATALQNSRTINNVSFNGTSNITITAASSTLLADVNTFSSLNSFANLLATGSSTLQNFTFINGTGTSATTTNFFATLASTTNLFATNLTAGSLTANGTINSQTISSAANFTGTLNVTSGLSTLSNLLVTGSSTLQNFTGLRSTTTNATTTSLAISSIISKLLKTDSNGSIIAAVANTDYQSPVALTTTGTSGAATFNGTTLNIPNYSAGSAASSTLLGDNNTFSGNNTFSSTITGSVSGNAGTATALQNSRTINNVSFNGTANITLTAASSTLLGDINTFSALNSFANLLASGSSTLQNFTALNSTSTNATTTAHFSTTASSTNLFSTNGNIGALTAVTVTSGLINGQTISSAANLTGTLNVTAGLTTLSNLLLSGSSTLQNFTALNSTSTNATTTSLAITSIVSKLLKTNGNGSLIAAVANTDYQSPVTLTTTGTGGAATFNGTTLNIPNYGAGSYSSTTLLGDNNTFSGNNIFNNTITGSVSGNAGTATALQNSRTINNVSFNGTSNITITAASSTLLADVNSFSSLNSFANLLATGSSTFQNFTGLNSTTTNATSTNSFANTASSTNLFSTFFTTGSLTANGTINSQTISAAANLTGTLNVTSGLTTLANVLVTGSSTFQNFTALNSTSTNATTTSLAVSSIVSKILKTNANGSIIAAVAGTDYQAPITPAALTKTDDTNVTLTLGGTPASALLQSVSLTLGWTGTLADSRVADNLTISGGTVDNTIIGGTTAAAGTFTNILATGSSTLQNFTGLNSTSTNATTTTFFATRASTTALFLSTGVCSGSSALNINASGQLVCGAVSGVGAASSTLLSDNNHFTGTNVIDTLTVTNATSTTLSTTIASTTNFTVSSIKSALLVTNSAGTASAYAGASACGANNFVTTISALGGTTCGSSTISGVALGSNLNSHSHDSTLTGTSYNGSAAVSDWGLNLANANSWTAQQSFTNANSIVATGSTTLQNFTFVNATGTSATTTSFFATTASSTNLFSTAFTTGSLTANGTINSQTISAAANLTGTLNVTAGLTTLSNLLLSGSSTLQNFTGLNSTTTNATTTSLAISSIVSKLLKTNANGSVIAAVAGTDYQAPITPAALTKTDDTNVTLTLGGTPASALLQSVSLTLGWTGTLADARVADNLTISGGTVDNTIIGGTTAAAGTFTNILATGSSTLQNFTFINGTGTSATTTNFFATNSSSTNLFVNLANGCAQVTNGKVTSTGVNCSTGGAGDPYPFQGAGNSTSTLTQFLLGLTSYSSSTISALTTTSGTTTNATSTTLSTTLASTTSFTVSGIKSALLVTNSAGTASAYGGASTCASNNFVTTISALGGTTCGTSTISGVSLGGTLGALTATDATLTFSASYDGSAARTVGLNLANANSWTAQQSFTNANSIVATGSTTLQNFTFVNATGSSATTTNFFATTASTSNLFAAKFSGAGLANCISASNALTWNSSTSLFGCNTITGSGGGTPNSKFATTTGAFLAITPNGGINTGLGIGTTTPAWVLQVASSTPYIAITDTDAATNAKHGLIGFNDGVFTFGTSSDSLNSTSTALSLDPVGSAVFALGTTSPFGKLAVNPIAGDTNQLVVGSSTATSFLIDPAGNVGIGTPSPIAKLHVSGTFLTTSSSTLQNFTFVNATGTSATTTSFFATTASSTKLSATTATIGTLTVGSCTGCGVGGASPGGTSDGNIQFKSGTSFAGSSNLNWDNTNKVLTVGTGAGSAAPALIVLDTGNTLADPTNGANGAMYYNSNLGTFRCFANSAWSDCGSKQTDYMTFVATSTPSAPASGQLRLFGRSVANRLLPAIIGPSGLDTALQPYLARNKVGYWNPQGNNTTVPGVFGFTAPTISTATARNVATTNVATRTRRIGFVTSTTAGTLANAYVTAAQYTIGDGAGNGGFTFITRFVPSDAAAVSGERFFIGLSSTVAAPTNVDPSTQTNQIGLAQKDTSTNCFIVYGGSAAQTAIDLGSNFDCSARSTQMFELALFAPPNSNNTVYYQVTRVSDGVTATGTLTGTAGTVLPASTTLLAFRSWKTNNATALAAGYDIASIYIETDN